jgi:hypothetical protein
MLMDTHKRDKEAGRETPEEELPAAIKLHHALGGANVEAGKVFGSTN